LEQHSKLSEKTAAELAVHVLHAIDHIRAETATAASVDVSERGRVRCRRCAQSCVLLEQAQPAAPIESADPDDGNVDD
jgi:hypothetical protein